MLKRYRFFWASVAVLLPLWVQAQGHYVPQDDPGSVTFKIRNFGLTVNGSFRGLTGDIVFDPARPAVCRFQVAVAAATLDTGIGARDNHLRKRDYFAVADYPTLRFVSTRVTVNSAGEGTAYGQLTLRDVTKEVAIPFRTLRDKDDLVFMGALTVNRRDFGVGGSSLTLADEVAVQLRVRASQP